MHKTRQADIQKNNKHKNVNTVRESWEPSVWPTVNDAN